MPRVLEFWFEFASTYSYPAAMQVEAMCAEAIVPLVWRSFLLGPVFGAQGMTDSPFNLYPVKGAYMWRDMERICADAGLAFGKPSSFPRGSLLAARIAACHGDAHWVGAFIRAVYRANFAEDGDISDDQIITGLLEDITADSTAILESTLSAEGKLALRNATQEAQDRGVFGAPTMLVGDELFWGHDRLRQAIAWAGLG